MKNSFDVAIVGAGFTGLTAAYFLSNEGYKVCVIDENNYPGGLASNFEFSDGIVLERFYHHWFNNDEYVNSLADQLGVSKNVKWEKSKTGMYFNKQIWRLSTPLDLLKFKAIPFWDRVRLGAATLYFPLVRNWHKLESLTIREWLEPIVGKKAFDVVWRPLIESKFSTYSDDVNAVWMWKKLALRGSTRNKSGAEELAYYKGGFGALAERLVEKIIDAGGEVRLGNRVTSSHLANGESRNLFSLKLDNDSEIEAEAFLLTPAFKPILKFLGNSLTEAEAERYNRVNYLGNICLVLRMSQSLSSTYWLNVNDPGFPFVGVIEHTNLDSPDSFGQTHIAYLSRYVDVNDPIWDVSDEDYLKLAKQKLLQMFPNFETIDILDFAIWRARYAQPIAEKGYSEYLPGHETSLENVFVYNMAQIYPEDRGTNYAIRDAKVAAKKIIGFLKNENVNK